MTPEGALNLVQTGGALAATLIAIWALVTRRIITRGEFDRAMADKDAQIDKLEGPLREANEELRKQSSTNARLVEMTLVQRAEAENIRRGRSSGDDR